jgi:hypothetical protein
VVVVVVVMMRVAAFKLFAFECDHCASGI